MPDATASRSRRSPFPTTRWSLVRAAGSGSGDAPRRALADLLEAYECPLYFYLRHWGLNPEDARDELQQFYVHVIEKSVVGVADPDRGRFRDFLLACLKHHLLNKQKHERTKQGGKGVTHVPLQDALDEYERRICRELATTVDPETLFDRAWAHQIVEKAVESLRQEYAARDQLTQFDGLLGKMDQEPDNQGYAELATTLGKSEGALRIALMRLKSRLGDRLRALVADTVADEGEVEAEIKHLMQVLGRPPAGL